MPHWYCSRPEHLADLVEGPLVEVQMLDAEGAWHYVLEALVDTVVMARSSSEDCSK